MVQKKRQESSKDEKVLVARITAAHGIKGLVKVQSLTHNPEDFIAYNPLVTENDEEIKLEIKGEVKGQFLAEASGISNRTEAEQLRGINLYAYRYNMGKMNEDEFMSHDVLGFEVIDESDTSYGSVKHVLNYGSSYLFEVGMDAGRTFLVPYTDQFVKGIDFANNRMTVLDVDQLLDLARTGKK